VLLADAAGVVVLLIGVAMAGLPVTAGTFATVLAALTLGALAWAALGTAASIVVPTAEATFPVIGLTYLPVILLSGVVGTIPGEPGWLTTAVHYLPANPLIEAVSAARWRPLDPAWPACPPPAWPCWPAGAWPGCWSRSGSSGGARSARPAAAGPGGERGAVNRAAVRAGLDELFTGVTQQVRSLDVFQAVR